MTAEHTEAANRDSVSESLENNAASYISDEYKLPTANDKRSERRTICTI